MISSVIPSVLQGKGGESSISMERALKQILELLESIDPEEAGLDIDSVEASIDDTKMMLAHIERG